MPALLKQLNQFNESYSTAQRHFHQMPCSMTFYKRAKALYDSDYEDDRIVTLQALILLGWYGEETGDVTKNVFYWNGLATTVAQGSGEAPRKPAYPGVTSDFGSASGGRYSHEIDRWLLLLLGQFILTPMTVTLQ
jgi:hypothetical protein